MIIFIINVNVLIFGKIFLKMDNGFFSAKKDNLIFTIVFVLMKNMILSIINLFIAKENYGMKKGYSI